MTPKQTAVLFSLMLGSGLVNAAVIDFESVATDQFGDPINADGFNWDFSASGWFIGPGTSAFHPNGTSNGTSKLVAAGDRDFATARVTMTQNGGGAFSLFGLDAATANMNEINSLSISGMFSGGGSISTMINGIDGTFDSYLLAGFVDLMSVTFSSVNSGSYNDGGFSLDNLRLDPINSVPEPTSLVLLGLGLAGFGLSRKKKLSD